ncbi:LysR family transcriptional regulator [Eubacterium sp. MSJ-13]|uniref:LysR family transcriptional regulator n=1 Tax=Eubacterium sp. MSJ-13 TaxID=2841513 RepID=UPI001C0F5969|nr:LysR family transcriptional regulator [Eubacterium sp. MSJ-13]MBU5479582.1 LysR family transcriptional regulator [Eubacterium sp. MSJ-13]
MTLIQLKYFCSACRCHSLTGAANELFVTQPAISLAIKELENEFGIVLFNRNNNKLSLTTDGEIFYEKAAYILQYCNEMQYEMDNHGKPTRAIRIGIPPILSSIFFPGMLDAYLDANPDANVTLEEYGSVRACDMILHDELDIALINMEMYNIDRLDSRVLLHDQLVFCVSPKHRLADKPYIEMSDIDGENVILFNKDSVQNNLLKSRFDTNNIKPNIVMQGSQLYTTINFIRNGNCGCFLYESVVAGLPKYKAIPLQPPLKTDIGIVWKKGRYITSQMQTFIQFAQNYW